MSMVKPTGKKRKLAEESYHDDNLKSPTETGRKSHLQVCGAAPSLTDLPHELLLEILEQLTCFQQERLVRVCKLWLRTISTEIDHVYLDAASLYKSHVNKAGLLVIYNANANSRKNRRDRVRLQLARAVRYCRLAGEKAAFPWKYNRRCVRQLAFDGQYVAYFGTANEALTNLAYSHFPELAKINLVHMVMDIQNIGLWPYDPDGWVYVREQLSAVPVSLKDSVVPAFPDCHNYHMIGSTVKPAREAQKVLGRYQDSCVRIPDVTLASLDEVGKHYNAVSRTKLAWPYPDSQLEWLAQWAPALNGNRRLLDLLRYNWCDTQSSQCRVHNQFCQHLKLAFYQQLNGQIHNVIALYLIQLKLAGMEPPPLPFQFEKFHLREGRSPRFGLAETR